ncbi:hypothetical protein [Marinoscillum sp.]|uniref:hypothetical protein n=1 Tax=Marinoscillum sp. TaxID=2024838 RepID=UPI003BAA364D
MIEYIQHTERHISSYLNGKLITNEGYQLNDGNYSNDNDILVSLEDLSSELIEGLPMGTGFFMMKEIPETNFIVTRIDKRGKLFEIEITADHTTFYDSIWNANNYIKRFSELNKEFEIKDLDFEDVEHPMIVMTYEYEYTSSTKIGDVFDVAFGFLISTKNLIELELKGFKWKKEYESNEMLFCNEVVTPLFRKMGLLNLEFTHGTTEHGKDYVFSEYTKFGTISHSAVQVKAGDLTGSAKGKLKEIIEQLDDAFMIPYEQLNSEEKKYIDTFYILTSGKITSQAIDKIKHKIKRELKGSVKFIDKHSLLSLIDKFWR